MSVKEKNQPEKQIRLKVLNSAAETCCGNQSGISTPVENDSVRDYVQEYYARRAVTSYSCCGDTPDNQFYAADMLAEMPDDVAGFSLGCGDPITLAQLRPGEVVLDLGSGGGLDCFLASKQVGEQGLVIGVDMTPEMLERARGAAAKMGIKNVEFRRGYLEKLPVEDNSVDVIISNCVINLSPDKTRVFAEMLRTLKPGGRISVSDIVTNGELPEQLRQDMQAWGACLAGALDMDDYIAGLEGVGFEEVILSARTGDGEVLDGIPQANIFSASITARKPGGDELI